MPEASVNFGPGVTSAWSNVATFVPEFVVFLIIAIVAIGGGIRTMSARWEAVAARYDEGKPRIAAAARTAPSVTAQARQAMPDGSSDGSSYGATATATRPQFSDPNRPAASHVRRDR